MGACPRFLIDALAGRQYVWEVWRRAELDGLCPHALGRALELLLRQVWVVLAGWSCACTARGWGSSLCVSQCALLRSTASTSKPGWYRKEETGGERGESDLDRPPSGSLCAV